ncbi:HNH endonuclease signature motif containing protein [Stigmatella sp. ncwal1]|uniref:HNH endonuclease signature motif containing protein n=1 Tax=Stigmatella ashevillensis TaxID=2995309 RepID=A0ABT5DFH8_9BACT|nr:HNH endonuclease signature motif containing protein [Stigmatella ashevillena]MDC0711106.1 HNH endonuclease signature motif containing protein [Stigmatella ashevillena]
MHISPLLLVLLPLILETTLPASEANLACHPRLNGFIGVELVGLPDASVSSEDARGFAAGSRAGKPFTKKGKAIVKERNAAQNDGKNRCENCGTETVSPKKHEKDVTPPPNEAHVDHIVPKAKEGAGEPDNGQVLCRDCNLEKSDKAP